MLGIGSDKRIAQASDIPTVAESGLPGYQAVTWFGLFGPAKLPPDLVGKLNAQVAKIFADPDFRAHFLEPQMFEAMPGSPEEFAAYIQSERAKWAKVIHEANITLE
jgi:tripartite-type tricarboxylate transporter receptor subunit TctC